MQILSFIRAHINRDWVISLLTCRILSLEQTLNGRGRLCRSSLNAIRVRALVLPSRYLLKKSLRLIFDLGITQNVLGALSLG